MPQQSDLSQQDRENLAGLLAAVRHPPRPVTLTEKLSVAEMIRKWFVHVLAALAISGGLLWRCAALSRQVADNTEVASSVKDLPKRMESQEKKMRKIRPLVLQHEWQVQQGYTNKDLKALNIKAPEFPEED